jgi:hypothetical protein
VWVVPSLKWLPPQKIRTHSSDRKGSERISPCVPEPEAVRMSRGGEGAEGGGGGGGGGGRPRPPDADPPLWPDEARPLPLAHAVLRPFPA